MIRFFVFALCVFTAHISSISTSYAQGSRGLVVTPKRVVFGPHDRIVEVLIANRGDEEQKYRISIVNRAMQENGQLKETNSPAEGEFFAKDFVRYSPRQVILGPKQAQKVRIMSRLKSDAADGEYRSHLLVQEIPKASAPENSIGEGSSELGINIQAIFGITLPIILRKGDLTAEVKLTNPKIRKAGKNTYLDITINRTGTKSILGSANIFANSQKVGIIKNVAVYMSTPHRRISIKLDPKHVENLSGKDIKVTFGAEEKNEDAPNAELNFTAP